MSIAAINEQLLRAVGVGIAVFTYPELTLQYKNEVFETWFSEDGIAKTLPEIFPTLDIDNLSKVIETSDHYATEWSFRKKRRTLAITQIFTRANISGEDVLILECQNITRIRELESMIESYSTMVERNTREIQREKEQVEKLLLNVMPRGVYDEYKNFGVVSPHKYDSVSVLVLDFMGFTETIDKIAPATLVSELNELFSAFDRIGEQFGCERIRTTGDTYLCVAGMQDASMNHAAAASNAALRFIRYIRRRNENADLSWKCRVGIGTGSVIGSVVGVQKYVYDVFGEAVETANAARQEAQALEILATQDVINSLNGEPEHEKARSVSAREAGFFSLVST